MLIDDGYTEELPGFPGFFFRRFLASELKQFTAFCQDESEHSEREARHMISSHIFDPTGARLPLAIIPQAVAREVLLNPNELSDLQNLKSGFRLMLERPLLAIRSCETCQKWWFDEDTGKVSRSHGVHLQRPEYAPVACLTDRGCPKGTIEKPESLKSFTERNRKAFEHWMNWRAVGCPNPNDAIIRRNWMWFTSMERHDGLRKLEKLCSKPSQRSGGARPVL